GDSRTGARPGRTARDFADGVHANSLPFASYDLGRMHPGAGGPRARNHLAPRASAAELLSVALATEAISMEREPRTHAAARSLCRVAMAIIRDLGSGRTHARRRKSGELPFG